MLGSSYVSGQKGSNELNWIMGILEGKHGSKCHSQNGRLRYSMSDHIHNIEIERS